MERNDAVETLSRTRSSRERSMRHIALPLALAVASGCVYGVDPNDQTTPEFLTGSVTTSFQDGVAPSASYAGTRDAFIRQYSPTTNYGSASTDRVDGDDPVGTGKDISDVIRWDLSSIPAGSTVRGVQLTVTVTNISAGPFGIYALDRGWTESQVTWDLASTGVPWSMAGAEGSSDRASTSLGTLSGSSTGARTITLNTAGIAAVQAWIDDPTTNHGFIVASSTTTDGLSWSSREATTASARPRITVSYDPPSTVTDAGTDSSTVADTAPESSVSDSGTRTDASTTDSGTSTTDSGSTVSDSGTSTTDSGSTVSDSGASDAGTSTDGGVFPLGTICNNSGTARTRPPLLKHVIVILMENKTAGAVLGNSSAPYFNSLAHQCGYSTGFVDNMFSSDLVSLPHYMALTSGSNCDTGVGSTSQTAGATGCITDDSGPSSHRLSTQSIFNQVTSWRAYEESMPSACDWSGSGEYAPKHNPPPYFTALSTCSSDDLPIAAISCSTTAGLTCATPSNALTQDLANDTLPEFVFVTPNLLNDMHDGTVSQGDNWLHTYLPLMFASPAYLRGETAIYVMWDEGSPGVAQPNLFISPYIQPTVSSATMNLFAVLRAVENQLGIGTHLGCAGGTPPGGIGTCASGSTADLRSIFNM